MSKETEFRVRAAKRKAKALGLSKQDTLRLVEMWKRMGSK